jgi:riboflavin biosynthesis pyrimidine reductase
LVASLAEAGLLDELRLIVHPVLVGAGQSISGVFDRLQRLELVAADPIAGGPVTLAYRLPPVP